MMMPCALMLTMAIMLIPIDVLAWLAWAYLGQISR